MWRLKSGATLPTARPRAALTYREETDREKCGQHGARARTRATGSRLASASFSCSCYMTTNDLT